MSFFLLDIIWRVNKDFHKFNFCLIASIHATVGGTEQCEDGSVTLDTVGYGYPWDVTLDRFLGSSRGGQAAT